LKTAKLINVQDEIRAYRVNFSPKINRRTGTLIRYLRVSTFVTVTS